MKKIFLIAAIPFVLGLIVSLYKPTVEASDDRGQLLIDKYLDRSNRDADKVKLHFAIALTTGRWNDRQRALILRGLNDRASLAGADVEILSAFSREDAGAVFYKIGSFDIEDLRHIYALPFGKSTEAKSWSTDRYNRLWQMNEALNLVRFDLDAEQQQFVIDFAVNFSTVTRENADQWNQRAVAVGLPRNVGRAVLTTIGDDRCPGQIAAAGKAKPVGNCVCTTKSYNWSCNDDCGNAGPCSIVEGDCGVAWLWDCNGTCSINQEN